MSAVYAAGALTAVLLLAFVSYYVYRLATATGRDGDADRRLSQMVSGALGDASAAGGALASISLSSRPGSIVRHPAIGLRRVYQEPVYLRRSKDGAVTFQAGGRASMPLKYLLDARSRALLEKVVGLASGHWGSTWAVLAEENEDGQLVLTLL